MMPHTIAVPRNWPLPAALLVLWLAIAICLSVSVGQNQGRFVYALDDPYIHICMARNLSQHGVWGVTKYGFSSASSSPLWTLLIAGTYWLVGVHLTVPLLLNVVLATLLVIFAYALLKTLVSPPLFIFCVLVCLILVTPLPALIFSGQEHIAHALVSIAFIYSASSLLSGAKRSLRQWTRLLALAGLSVVIRYESLFMVLALVGLLLVRRWWAKALVLAGAVLLPVIGFALFSRANGGYFLPNSVLIKGNAQLLLGWATLIRPVLLLLLRLALNPPLLVLLIGGLAVLRAERNGSCEGPSESMVLASIFIPAFCLHLMFGRTGSLYRYEAYLCALGMMILAPPLSQYLRARLPPSFIHRPRQRELLPLLLVVAALLPFAARAYSGLCKTPQAMVNIYQQQYQMGLFIREYYQGSSVGLNDIGAVNYLADIRCLDLWGLASASVARAKIWRSYDSQFMYNLAKEEGVRVAVVYDDWFREFGGIPALWVPVGRWQIHNNVVCGDDVVSFYAVDPTEKENLVENLREFASLLPTTVTQSGTYISETGN